MPESLPTSASEWIVRMHAGNMSAADRVGLDIWLAQDPRHIAEFRIAQNIWTVSHRLDDSLVGQRELKALATPAESASNWEPVLTWTRMIGTRAVALGGATAVALAAFSMFSPPPAPGLPNLPNGSMAETAVDQITSYTLPDGSTLTVAADSAVRVAFNDDQRHVVLERGEAFFEVTRNPARPFVVTAGARNIVVTGTKFDIDYGNTDQAVEVAVVEGHVQVAPNRATPTALLPTNSLIAGDVILFPEGKPGIPQKISAAHVAAWRTRRLYFDQSTLRDVVTEVNRYSPKPLVLADSGLGELKLSGYFRAGDVDAVLFSLGELYKVQVKDIGDAWVLTGTEPPKPAPAPRPQKT